VTRPRSGDPRQDLPDTPTAIRAAVGAACWTATTTSSREVHGWPTRSSTSSHALMSTLDPLQ